MLRNFLFAFDALPQKTSLILWLGLFVGLVSGCDNAFKSMANKETDEALYEDILKMNNAQNFDGAIEKIDQLSLDFKASNQVRRTIASVYAGKCGLSFIQFISDMGGMGSTKLLPFLMSMWTLKNSQPEYCVKAQSTMEEISASASGRSASDSFFMLVLGLVKIGVYLKAVADVSPTDGVVDNPPFDGTAGSFCSSANISNAAIAEIGTGLGLIIANLANLGGAVSGLDLGDISDTCNSLGNPNPCRTEDQDLFLTGTDGLNLRLAVRTLLNTNAIGFFDPGFVCLAE